MKKTVRLLTLEVAVASMILAFASCRPEPKPNPDPEKPELKYNKIEYLDVSDYLAWTYYSLKDNKVYKTVKYNDKGELEGAPAADDKSWDIAFHRWDVITRDGAFKSDITDIKKASEAKLGDFTKDVERDITYIFAHGATNKKTKTVSNPLMSGGLKSKEGWCVLTGMPPKYTIAENVWFVKTAEGKNAAIKFTDCKKKDGKPIGISAEFVILN